MVQKVVHDHSTKTYYRLEGCYFHSHDFGIQLTNINIRKFSTIPKIEKDINKAVFNQCFNWERELDIGDDYMVEKRLIPYLDFNVFTFLTFI